MTHPQREWWAAAALCPGIIGGISPIISFHETKFVFPQCDSNLSVRCPVQEGNHNVLLSLSASEIRRGTHGHNQKMLKMTVKEKVKCLENERPPTPKPIQKNKAFINEIYSKKDV